MALLLLATLLGCAPSQPTTPEGCGALSSDAARDECFLAILPGIFKSDPAKGIALAESSIQDPATRDFVWLTVTRDVDPNSEKYCARIVDPLIRDRCKVLVARPHLHRELLDGRAAPMRTGGPGGPPGGPPPGAPGAGAPAGPPPRAP